MGRKRKKSGSGKPKKKSPKVVNNITINHPPVKEHHKVGILGSIGKLLRRVAAFFGIILP